MNRPPAIIIKGPRFWIGAAAVSLCGTLASLLTAMTPEQAIRDALHIPPDAIHVFTWVAFLGALGASFVGFWSMLLAGVKQVGALEIAGWRLPLWVHVAICIAAYMVPWTLVLTVVLTAWAVGI